MEDGQPAEVIGSVQAAELLGWSVRTVQRKADTGEIPVIRTQVGRRKEYVFDAAAIEEIAHKEADPS
jgi:excisionase family DNA binding protein